MSGDRLSLRQVEDNLRSNVYITRKRPCNSKSSKVWQIFEQIVNTQPEDDDTENLDVCLVEGFVFCSVCKQVLPHSEKNGTNQLLRHKKQHEGNSQNQQSDNNSIANHFPIVNKKFGQELRSQVKDTTTQFVVSDGRPFNTVKGIGFINLLALFTQIGAKKGKLTTNEIKDLLPDPTSVRNG